MPMETPKLSAGQFIESFEVQLVVIGLLVSDIFISAGRIALESDSLSSAIPYEINNETQIVLLGALKTFNHFSVVIFVGELAVLFLTFRVAFLKHFGYLLDLCVVIFCISSDIISGNAAPRLLSLFRLWRVARIMNTVIDNVRAEANVIRNVLEEERSKTVELLAKNKQLEDTIRRERESKRALERTMQGYKDEVDTLNEALRIAAFDIAGVALQPSDDEDDSGAESEKGSNKDDEDSHAVSTTRPKIVVNADGTFTRN